MCTFNANSSQDFFLTGNESKLKEPDQFFQMAA